MCYQHCSKSFPSNLKEMSKPSWLFTLVNLLEWEWHTWLSFLYTLSTKDERVLCLQVWDLSCALSVWQLVWKLKEFSVAPVQLLLKPPVRRVMLCISPPTLPCCREKQLLSLLFVVHFNFNHQGKFGLRQLTSHWQGLLCCHPRVF